MAEAFKTLQDAKRTYLYLHKKARLPRKPLTINHTQQVFRDVRRLLKALTVHEYHEAATIAEGWSRDRVLLFDTMCQAFTDYGPPRRYPFEAVKYAIASILVSFRVEDGTDFTVIGERLRARSRQAHRRQR
jgi:hypothetical protein